ncbi:MAG: hypothetical protein RBS17_10730 [Coriobacteriia bacterium]|nr:hypothetical protein [Coriobacteriia bacterium]
MEAIERWRDSLPAEAQTETVTAAAAIGGGLLVGGLMVSRKRKGFFAWAIPGALLALGVVLLLDIVFDARAERIEAAGEHISAELASLDPVARAQVLKSVGEQQVEAMFGE